jgi:GNAT superfamily N-acetyltransferase
LARISYLAYGYISGRFVRISALKPADKPQILQHLIDLSSQDRYLRFGYLATDEHIQKYVEGLNFQRDDIFGIYHAQRGIVAMAHLAKISETDHPLSFGLATAQSAEFGVSVSEMSRGLGLGGRLFERAITHARNQGVQNILIHALTENMAMLHIVRKRGATLVNAGSETTAYLRLPDANFESHTSEFLADHFGNVDYNFAHGMRWLKNFGAIAITRNALRH